MSTGLFKSLVAGSVTIGVLALGAAALATAQQNTTSPQQTPTTQPSTGQASSGQPASSTKKAPGASTAASGTAGKQAAASDSGSLYTVKDGNKVDNQTLQGWRTWRALACERCHGANQEGLVGPPLVESMKKISKEQFHEIMMKGRPEKGMPPFNTSKMVNDNWEGLYGYLKGRSDGKIKPGRVEPLDAKG